MSMSDTSHVQIRELDQAEAQAILARNHLGRLAFTFHDHVDIEPIGYVYANGVINCRTSRGAKLGVLRHQPSVAFEVDEVEGPFQWRSVVVHGTVYVAEPEGSDPDRKAYAEALQALQHAYPGALGSNDPAAFRDVILRLHVGTLRGRAAQRGVS